MHVTKEAAKPYHVILFKFDICFDFYGSKTPLGDCFKLENGKKDETLFLYHYWNTLSFFQKQQVIKQLALGK